MARVSASSQGAPIGLTMGEPAGIGGELTLMAWQALRDTDCRFVVLDDADRLQNLAESIKIATPIKVVSSPVEACEIFPDALPVLHAPLKAPVSPGKPTTATAEATIRSIEIAHRLCGSGELSALVTNPIHKKNLMDAGFKFPGHTEFLAHLDGKRRSVMMLAAPELRVVPITVHQSLRTAIRDLGTEEIIAQGEITARALHRDFGIAAPRLAVAGLNPHAGEQGAMGDEEQTIIIPAVQALQAAGIDARGPYPPDTLFHEAARKHYDAVLCMYHDQALIPIKAIAFDRAVNVTLGLDIVRASPDHGTAFDLAGTGRARPDSLIAAIRLAGEIAANRRG